MTTKNLFMAAMLLTATIGTTAQTTPASQMEKLNRGVVAIPLASGNFVSWRLLGTEDAEHTTFDLIREGEVVATGLTKSNYRDTKGAKGASYQVVTRIDGETVETSEPVTGWLQTYKSLKLDRPAGGTLDGEAYDYSPNDCSVGDVDGDGEYELFVKWYPSNAKDNSQSGTTGNTYIDCYKLDGTKLWRVDLGCNIRSGAHYTQFMVYDFDGDGLAEMMCKTAPGSIDGLGNYVNQAATEDVIRSADNKKSWVVSGGRINGGQEYLTVFQGATGKAIHTIFYNPNRNQGYGGDAAGTTNWGQPDNKNDTGSYGNRGERYLAAVAYLDGPDQPASGIFSRGYYGYAFIWAVGFDGKQLYQKWLSSHKTKTSYSLTTYEAGVGNTRSFSGLKPTSGSGSGTMFGNGNHNLSIGDVDGDGCDEIIWGSAALDNDGSLLYGTGFGHGDAIHMGQMVPGKKSFQVFQVHEEKGTYAWDLHDAATGEILYKGGPEGVDNGRGMAAQLSKNSQEWWFSSADERQQRSAVTGEVASTANGSVNFRMYWDGSAQDALLDGTKLTKYNDSSKKFTDLKTFAGSTCNSTKATPNLSADIFGDWREELILWNADDGCTIYIHSTTTETPYAVPTLMHDHTYRMGICWQNTAYNQPPHLGYNLAEAVAPKVISESMERMAALNGYFEFSATVKRANSLLMGATVLPNGRKLTYAVPEGFEFTKADDNTSLKLTGTPTEEGLYKFAIRMTGLNNEVVYDTLYVTVTLSTGIEDNMASAAQLPARTAVYNLAGHRLPTSSMARLPKGAYIVRTETTEGTKVKKIVVSGE